MNILLNPVFLFFIIILVGNLLGNLKIFNFSFGVSAVLIVAIIVGLIISKINIGIFSNEIVAGFNIISKLGTSIFMSVIGIKTGSIINKKSIKKGLIGIITGSLMATSGLIITLLIVNLDLNVDKSLIYGIYCGSMTSTPALAAMCELQNVNNEFAVLGYGISYAFGVVGVVLFVQLFYKNYLLDYSWEILSSKQGNENGLIIVSLVCFIGNFLGNMQIPIVNTRVGVTGGVLLTGIIIGFIKSIFSNNSRISDDSLSVYKVIGLTMFFVGNGIIAGQKLNQSISFKWFVYGAIITVFSMLIGYLISTIYYKTNRESMFIVAGGMTSTPALASLLKTKKDNSSIEVYSFAYLGALITMVILVPLVI